MLFPEEEAPVLKAWIVKRLENTLVFSLLRQLSMELLANTRGIGPMPMPTS
jgi:hypothetical protein